MIVHKIDRFARDRYDDAHYKRLLKLAGVHIEYVEQQIDGSPEGIILESVLVGMAEYYSRNLAKEVKKGLNENALRGQHNDGIPPLAYDVLNGQYVINEQEATIIREIFSLRVKRKAYTEIILYLQNKGYKTKRGGEFGKNSIHDLLKNKKTRYRGPLSLRAISEAISNLVGHGLLGDCFVVPPRNDIYYSITRNPCNTEATEKVPHFKMQAIFRGTKCIATSINAVKTHSSASTAFVLCHDS